MASQEQLSILKQGAEAWNHWRLENRLIKPDLENANLIGLSLVDVNLTGANLQKADLSGTKLNNAKLNNTNLSEATLDEADLRGANLNVTNLRKAKLAGADFSEAKLQELDELIISQHIKIRSDDLSLAILSEAELREAGVREAEHRESDPIATDLRGAILTQANLVKANFSGANLSDASLSGANLRAAYFSRAVLQMTDFSMAMIGWTTFGNNDLSSVKGLETIVHYGPSGLDIDTIYRSRKSLPEEFLRGCGAPEDFINYVRSLNVKSQPFYSCFISYSGQDERFTRRLHADLQNNGVSCWFAPEDLRTGDVIRERIYKTIKLYDKLLLILSESSIKSQWVRDEVEAAFERERTEKRRVLFPIQIDDAVNNDEKADWAVGDIRIRQIGDFRRWKYRNFYQKAFDRLLRDLKADE